MNRVVLALFVIVFITAAAFPQAQMSTGDIKGTVIDPSGAVVPGATRQPSFDAGGTCSDPLLLLL